MCKYFIKMHVYINTLIQILYGGFKMLHTGGSGVFYVNSVCACNINMSSK